MLPGIPASVQILRDLFGGDFEVTSGKVSVGVAATQLLKNDPERVSLTIINLGADNVYVTPDNAPSTTEGILLTASGGSMSIDVRTDGMLPTREWYAISSVAGQAVYFIANRRYIAA